MRGGHSWIPDERIGNLDYEALGKLTDTDVEYLLKRTEGQRWRVLGTWYGTQGAYTAAKDLSARWGVSAKTTWSRKKERENYISLV
jgi:hypothetical protein